MKTGFRIALRLLAPPFLGAAVGIIAAATWQLFNGGRVSTILQEVHDYPPTFLYAYIFGIIPSAVYAATMEFALRRGLQPGRRGAVLLSGGLGFVAGVSILLPFAAADWKVGWECLYLGAVGLSVGLLLEWIMGRLAPASVR